MIRRKGQGSGTSASSVEPVKGQEKKGVTLIELLAVIAILVIFAGFLLPALNGARSRSRAAVCMVHLRQLVLAVRFYADDFDGVFPAHLYGEDIAAYYANQMGVVICPDDDTDFTLPSSPRGSYGVNTELSAYKLGNLPETGSGTGKPIPILGDSSQEFLDQAHFSDRHRGRGNIGFIDAHVESKTVSEAEAYF